MRVFAIPLVVICLVAMTTSCRPPQPEWFTSLDLDQHPIVGSHDVVTLRADMMIAAGPNVKAALCRRGDVVIPCDRSAIEAPDATVIDADSRGETTVMLLQSHETTIAVQWQRTAPWSYIRLPMLATKLRATGMRRIMILDIGLLVFHGGTWYLIERGGNSVVTIQVPHNVAETLGWGPVADVCVTGPNAFIVACDAGEWGGGLYHARISNDGRLALSLIDERSFMRVKKLGSGNYLAVGSMWHMRSCADTYMRSIAGDLSTSIEIPIDSSDRLCRVFDVRVEDNTAFLVTERRGVVAMTLAPSVHGVSASIQDVVSFRGEVLTKEVRDAAFDNSGGIAFATRTRGLIWLQSYRVPFALKL